MKLMSFLRQSGEERTQRVLTGSVYGTMLFLAVPSFLMLISQALATTFDNWFILNYSDLSSSGAVSYGMQAFNVIYNAGIGLSVARAVVAAHRGKITAFSKNPDSISILAVFPSAIKGK